MAFSVGIIKEISGVVIAKNSVGQERILKVGDNINSEETISTVGGDSHVLLVLTDGRHIFLGGNNVVVLDKSLYASDEGLESDALSEKHSYLISEDRGVHFSNLSSFHHNSASDTLAITPNNTHLSINPADILDLTEKNNEILKIFGEASPSTSLSSSSYAVFSDYSSMHTSAVYCDTADHSLKLDLLHTYF